MQKATVKTVLFIAAALCVGLFIGWMMGLGFETQSTQEAHLAPSADVATDTASAKGAGNDSNPESGGAPRAKISRQNDAERIVEYRDLFVEEKQKEIEARIERIADKKFDEQIQRQREAEALAKTEERKKKQNVIDDLLSKARDAMEREAYHRPKDDNALRYYRQILAVAPEDQRAIEGLKTISQRFVEKARFFFTAGDYFGARAAADVALATRTDNTSAIELLKAIDEQQPSDETVNGVLLERDALVDEIEQLKTELRQQELVVGVKRESSTAIEQVLTAANSALQDGRLVQPENDNAYIHFQRALNIDSYNGRALAGVQEVRNRLLRSGTQFVRSGNFGRARQRVDDLNIVEPSGTLSSFLNQLIVATEQGPQIQTSNITPDQSELARKLREAEIRAADAELALRALEQSIANGQSGNALPASAGADGLVEGVADYDGGRYDSAYGKLNSLAEDGEPRAMFRVAVMQYYGRGTDTNRDVALSTMVRAEPAIRRAAEAGFAWAQFDVGLMYENGWVVARDIQRAIAWYRRSADQNYGAAYNNLGVLYEQGDGVNRDRSKAIEFLRLAAEQGNAIARENLAQLGVN